MGYTKYTESFYDVLKTHIPKAYIREDSDGVLAKMLMGFAESFGGMQLAIENLTDITDADVIPQALMEHLSKNFGIAVDFNSIESQRRFIANAGKWIDRKGTRDSFKALVDSYGLDADIDELVDYVPKCGDVYDSPPPSGQPDTLICGTGVPYWVSGTADRKAGTMIEVDEEDPAFRSDYISERFRIQLSSEPDQETKDAIQRAIEYLTPISSTFRGFTYS